jgi:UDP-GlcNAc:undecaprenyl-phosphate GlcNAc-1-phosphate transferase
MNEHIIEALVNSVKYVAAFALGLLLTFMLTPLIRAMARTLGMVDQPDARRVHTVPTPRGGGLAILLAFHLAMVVVVLFGWDHHATTLNLSWWLVFLQASAVLAIIGFMDDKFGLSAWLKLAGQIFVASLMYLYGYGFQDFFGLDVPEWINFATTLLWFVLLTNAFNLIDGLDGLASGLALIAALGLAGALLLRGMSGDTLPLLILAGACLGFLRYNFNPASVFLGDTGSLFLGFSLASMSLISASKGTLLTTMAVPLLAMGVPLYDTLLAVWRRSVRSLLPIVQDGKGGHRGVMGADKEHLHHRFLALGLSQRRVAIILYALNVVLVVVALLLTGMKSQSVGIFLLALVAWAYVMFRHLSRIEVWETGRLFVRGFSRPKRRSVVIAIYGLWDFASLVGVWAVVFFALDIPGGRVEFLQTLVLMVAPVVFFLLLGGIYERIWSRARLREYILLILLVVAGAVTGAALQILLRSQEQSLSLNQLALYAPLAALMIVGVRGTRRMLHEFMSVLEASRFRNSASAERVLVYGAGGRFQLFLSEHLFHVGDEANNRLIVGVIDDDPNLRGCRVSGVPVLGNMATLPSVIKTHRITHVVITALMPTEKKLRIAAAAREAGALAREWRYEEVEVG